MHLEDLRIQNFRCLLQSALRPGSGINLIIGDNASGKSSVLEAIFYLGRGRSFRGTRPAQLVRRGSKAFTLGCRVQPDSGRSIWVGARGEGNTSHFKLDGGENVTTLDLVTALPVQMIDPNLHRLIEEGPRYRRQFMDWGVFHVEHAFYSAWRRFRRALKQRNKALRAGAGRQTIVSWDGELVDNAHLIDASRRDYLTLLGAALPEMTAGLFEDKSVVLDYYPGWPQDKLYADTLKRMLSSDMDSGHTHAGPHRADLRIRFDGLRARGRISRGQQKVLTMAMLLAQALVLERQRGVCPILLIDDMGAELGPAYLQAMLDRIAGLRSQSFLTFLERPSSLNVASSTRMFHVEHNDINVAE